MELDANTGSGLSYQWLNSNGLIAGANGYIYNATLADNYRVIETNGLGCTDTSGVVTISLAGYKISGTIIYDNKEPLCEDTIFLSKRGDSKHMDSVGVNNDGTYEFDNLCEGKYTLTCKTKLAWGGGNPTDALIVNNCFIEKINFGDSLKKIAGNVNYEKRSKSNRCMLLINRRFIGSVYKFKLEDWIFVKYSLKLRNKPILAEISDSNITVNIKAICAGDVNASYRVLGLCGKKGMDVTNRNGFATPGDNCG